MTITEKAASEGAGVAMGDLFSGTSLKGKAVFFEAGIENKTCSKRIRHVKKEKD